MSTSPIQFSLPFCRGEGSEEKADCLYYSKIAVFAISIILLIAGILASSGAFGNLGGEIGWTMAALGIVGLAISRVRCSNNPSDNSHREAPIMSSTSQTNRRDPLPTWPTWQEDSLSQPYSNLFSTSHVGSSYSSYRKETQSGNPHLKTSTCQPQTASFSYRGSPPSDKQSAINWVMNDPNRFQNLSYDLRNDEDVVVAALNGCKSSEQAKKVIGYANYSAKNSKKVALALVRIDPTQLGQLNYDAKNDEDVVAAALNGCKSSKQAKKVIGYANYSAKNSKKVALALVRIDPTLLGQLNYAAKNDLDVVFLAIELSTKHTIDKIWSSIGINAALNKKVRAKVEEKYPDFFQDQAFDDAFPTSNTPNTPNPTPHTAAQTEWLEPDDLKGNTSDGANVARKILKQNHLLAKDLTKTTVSKEMAKSFLCRLLELDVSISDKDLKKAYQKAVLYVHPDKLQLQSGEEAFKALTAAYTQADL